MPFVVRYDALVDTPRTDSRPVLNIDLAPTFARLGGAAAPGVEGRSFLPLVAGDQIRWRNRFLVEHARRNPPAYCVLRKLRYSFAAYKTGERELYDLAQDPYELTNVAGLPSSAGRVAKLRKQLARLCNPPPPGLHRLHLCTVEGTAGRDVLRGTRRYDILCGRGGHDTLLPGPGPDYVYGGRGNDRIRTRGGGRDVISCGPGRDVVVADRRDKVKRDCEVVRRR